MPISARRKRLFEGENEGIRGNLRRIGQAAKEHRFKDETEAGITMKLKRGTFSATFFLACLAAMELEGVVLEEI